MSRIESTSTITPATDNTIDWWKSAVIYQIYPRSFQDSNGDGIGDIPGIIQRLEYIASLNIDAIWISPFFKSPMKDFGYDISNYRKVDPIFGNLEDFDELVSKAHQFGIRIIIDQVLSHTSDQHEWFQQSRQSVENEKADWYVWADAAEDGTPPNNWLSIFGGSAWQWDSRRQQYYFHNFLSSQPDLNLHNSDVQQQLLDEVEFWLKRGVDGVRLDAIVHCFHDQQLRDNPKRPEEVAHNKGCKPENPYAAQLHEFTTDRPENIGFIEKIRALLDRYPGTVALGEVSSDDSLNTIGQYTRGNERLHTAYCFELLGDEHSAKFLRETAESLINTTQNGWPCWAVGNHDSERVVSRWGDHIQKHPAQINSTQATMLTALITSLRGPACLYQGDELGLPEADVPFELLQDPYGKEFWPEFKGRDGCRTPIPWTDKQPSAGFSNVEGWLPVDSQHFELAVINQHNNPDSALNIHRHFLHWRQQQPALCLGDIEFLSSDEPVLVFQRHCNQQTLLIAFNLSNEEQQQTITIDNPLTVLSDHDLLSGTLSGQQINLPAYGVLYAELE